jgi:HPt (histidine-containing phosphotransfer) domain-containing protein
MYKYSEVLDSTCLNDLYGEDTDYALQMFEIYVDMIGGQCSSLIDAVKAEDRELLRKVAHKIKPVFTMVGLPQLTTLSEQIEKESASESQAWLVDHSSELHQKVTDTLPTIKTEIEQLKKIS